LHKATGNEQKPSLSVRLCLAPYQVLEDLSIGPKIALSMQMATYQEAFTSLSKTGWAIDGEGLETVATEAEVGPEDTRPLHDLLLNVSSKQGVAERKK